MSERFKENYEGLANAIIVQAVKDYRSAQEKLKENPESKFLQNNIRRIGKFFRSDWFKVLSHADGPAILKRLEEECSE